LKWSISSNTPGLRALWHHFCGHQIDGQALHAA
jgi:hypothetical protein